jgi:hypothetical protein
MVYRTVYPWYRYDSLYSVIFSLSNIDCILTRTRVWGFVLNSIPYGISIGADTVHSALGIVSLFFYLALVLFSLRLSLTLFKARTHAPLTGEAEGTTVQGPEVALLLCPCPFFVLVSLFLSSVFVSYLPRSLL